MSPLGSAQPLVGSSRNKIIKLLNEKERILDIIKQDSFSITPNPLYLDKYPPFNNVWINELPLIPCSLWGDKEIWINIVSKSGMALKYATRNIKCDKDVVLTAVQQDGKALYYASSKLCNDKDVVLAAVKQDGLVIKLKSNGNYIVHFSMRNDKDIVFAAVQQDGSALEFAKKWHGDRELVLIAIKNNNKQKNNISSYIDPIFGYDKEVVLNLIGSGDNDVLKNLAGDNMCDDDEVALAVIANSIPGYDFGFKYLSDRLKDNKDIVLVAVKKVCIVFEFVSERLKNDREVVLEAIRQDGRALIWASARLQDDREVVVLEAVRQHDLALRRASARLRDDREVVLEAIRQDGRALEDASARLRDDREMVLEAIRQDGRALRWASAILRDDREVVLEAVRDFGRALKYASARLKDDREVKYIAKYYKTWKRIFGRMVIYNRFIKVYNIIRYIPGNSGYLEAFEHYKQLN